MVQKFLSCKSQHQDDYSHVSTNGGRSTPLLKVMSLKICIKCPRGISETMDFCKYQVGITTGDEGCDNIQVGYFKPIHMLFIKAKVEFRHRHNVGMDDS